MTHHTALHVFRLSDVTEACVSSVAASQHARGWWTDRVNPVRHRWKLPIAWVLRKGLAQGASAPRV